MIYIATCELNPLQAIGMETQLLQISRKRRGMYDSIRDSAQRFKT